MCGLWSTLKTTGSKFRNKINNGWNKTKNFASNHAETIGKIADVGANVASLFGPSGVAIGSAIKGAKKAIANNTDENSALGKFARSQVSKEGSSSILSKASGSNNYSMNTQSAGGYGVQFGGGKGRYRHKHSLY